MANIPSEYLTYWNKINKNDGSSGDDFFWSDYPVDRGDAIMKNPVTDPLSYTYFKPSSVVTPTIIASPFTTTSMTMSPKCTAYLVSGENEVTMTITGYADVNMTPNDAYFYLFIASNNKLWTNSGYMTSRNTYYNSYSWQDRLTYTAPTIAAVLQYMQDNMRYININVDGVDWTDETVANWRCVPAITGRKGTYNLSMINEDFINDGDPVTSAPLSNIDVFAPASRIENLLDQMLADNVGHADFLFSGVVNALTITKLIPALGIGTTLYSFYILDVLKYQAAFNRLDGGEHFLCMLIDDENELARPSLITRNSGVVSYNQELDLTEEVMHDIYIWLIAGADEDPQDDSTDNLDNEDDGADTWNPHQDVPIPGPDNPTKGAINTGFTSMYQITDTELRDLSAFLWSDNFLNNVKKFFNDPREIIVGLTVMPIAGTIASTPQEIKAGGISTGVQGNKLLSQYHTIDMGSVPINPETNTFLDFPSFTKVSAVLPYIGEVQLDVNDIMGKTVHLKYVFDLLYGDLAAFLSVDGSAKYCFTGKAGVRIPTSSEDFSQVYAGGLQALGGIVSGLQALGSGNVGGLISSAGNVVSALSQMHPTVQYQGGGSGSAGFVGNQRPFIKFDLTTPLLANTGSETEEEPEAFRQRSFLGKTTYQNRKLSVSSCKGYTKCIKVHLVNIPCLDEELNEIEQLLLSGVIIQTGSTTPSGTPSTPGRFVITFLKSKSEHEVIGKKWSQAEADIKSLEGALLYDQSITTPKIIVEGDIRGFNYCYISEFGRFYYITDCIVRTGNIQEISLKVDVLQSFESQIKNCRAVVERQENHGNNYMQDSYMWAQNNRRIVTLPFSGGDGAYTDTSGAACFNRSNNTFILTIAGDN